MFYRGTENRLSGFINSCNVSQGIHPKNGKTGFNKGKKAQDKQHTMQYNIKIPHPINEDDYIVNRGVYIDNSFDDLSLEDVKSLGWFPEDNNV